MQKQNITETVQYNCNIADSFAANDYTLCVYLLKMREYYRWENKLGFDQTLEKESIGDWISKREAQWNDLENMDYADINIGDTSCSPFDSEQINQQLKQQNLVYSGGLNQHHRPHFFLARLHKYQAVDDYHIYITSTELARELSAPPAMSQNKTIFIRRESLKRMIWERLDEWRWKKGQGAMSRALAFYDFDNDLDRALEQMTEHETDVLLHHEMGEIHAGKHLGESWHDMLADLPRSKANFMARAVRDHMADCYSTLPMLLNENRQASIHFYFGNFNAMRKEIFPSLFAAYEQWQKNNNLEPLIKAIKTGTQHWSNIADRIITEYKANEMNCTHKITQLVDNHKL